MEGRVDRCLCFLAWPLGAGTRSMLFLSILSICSIMDKFLVQSVSFSCSSSFTRLASPEKIILVRLESASILWTLTSWSFNLMIRVFLSERTTVTSVSTFLIKSPSGLLHLYIFTLREQLALREQEGWFENSRQYSARHACYTYCSSAQCELCTCYEPFFHAPFPTNRGCATAPWTVSFVTPLVSAQVELA